MNEQIRKLALKATEVETIDDLFGGIEYRETFNKEKFAELLVKETLQVARAGIEYGNGMEEAVYKYFGVKE
jgi:hypothetical protein